MSGPQLFSPFGAVEVDPGAGPGVDTPLGRVEFTVYADGELVAASAAWRCGPHTVWRYGESVECLLNPRLAVELPPGMRVDGAAAVVCRCRADETAAVGYWFGDGFTDLVPIAISDLGLYTETFTVDALRITLGTPWPDEDGCGFTRVPWDGRQTHLTCAWAREAEGEESTRAAEATWAAVDRRAFDLLAFE